MQVDQGTTGNAAGSELDAGSFGGGNEGARSGRQDPQEGDDTLGSTVEGEETAREGADGGSIEAGRTVTGSAMTGQTDVLGEDGNSGSASGAF